MEGWREREKREIISIFFANPYHCVLWLYSLRFLYTGTCVLEDRYD